MSRSPFADPGAPVRVAVLGSTGSIGRQALDVIERLSDRFRVVVLAGRHDVDVVLVATGGIVSLRPVLAALEAGKVVATANKETLVAGGHMVMPVARHLAAPRASGGNVADPLSS